MLFNTIHITYFHFSSIFPFYSLYLHPIYAMPCHIIHISIQFHFLNHFPNDWNIFTFSQSLSHRISNYKYSSSLIFRFPFLPFFSNFRVNWFSEFDLTTTDGNKAKIKVFYIFFKHEIDEVEWQVNFHITMTSSGFKIYVVWWENEVCLQCLKGYSTWKMVSITLPFENFLSPQGKCKGSWLNNTPISSYLFL